MLRNNRAPAPCANTQAAPLAADWPWLTRWPPGDCAGPAVMGDLPSEGDTGLDRYYGG
jgi:hypothetical protein